MFPITCCVATQSRVLNRVSWVILHFGWVATPMKPRFLSSVLIGLLSVSFSTRGGNRTRTDAMSKGFSYHYSFHYQPYCCLWSGLYLNLIFSDLGSPCLVSTPSLSGLARDYHFKGFPEFDEFYYVISNITPPI